MIFTKFSYLNYFLFNISFFKYIFYLFNKNINPVRSNKFSNFIKLNKKKWIEQEDKKNSNISNSVVLVENFVNHPAYMLSNPLIGKYVQLFHKSQCLGLLRKGDIKAEVLFRSFGISKFYYYKTWNFFQRCVYIYKALKILQNVRNVKTLYNLKINKIDIGLTSIDTYIRYTRNPTVNKINLKLISFFAEGLFASDFFEKIFSNLNIKKLIQSENLYIPSSILFQKALIKKNTIYSRCGREKATIRIYTSYNQRYKCRFTTSKRLFNEVYKNFKTQSINEIKKHYQKQIKTKSFGVDRFKFENLNNSLQFVSKSELCKIFKWDEKKKIGTIFLHILIDGNCKHGKRKLFLDNYTWAKYTLETIKKLKNINWIIKQHPSENIYNAKFNFEFLVRELEKKYDHIRWYPENLDPTCLLKSTNVAITSHGTASAEYPSFGIPCIVAEKSHCTGYGFTLEPKNIREYKNLLEKADKINKLNNRLSNKAKVLMFIINMLVQSKFSFMPEFTLSRKINENHFWYNSSKNLKKFNLSKDQFKKNFEKQINLKFRHTINFKLYPFIGKTLNDN